MNTSNQFLSNVVSLLERNSNTSQRKFKLQTILKRCGGYKRRSERFVSEFNSLIETKGLMTRPVLTTHYPHSKDDWVYFKLKSDKNNFYVKVKKQMNKNFKPYPHQKQAWNSMDKHYIDNNKSRGMIVVPTAGGKTTIAAKWLIDNCIDKGFRVLWFAHRVELLEQAKETFLDFSYLNGKIDDAAMPIISMENDSWKSIYKDQLIVFSTDKSAARNLPYLQNMINDSSKGIFVVIDEAHHAVAPEYQSILKTLYSFKGKKVIKLLGLTATPKRMNPNETHILWRIFDDNYNIININRNLSSSNEKSYNSKIYEISQNELINQGILSKPIPLTVKTDLEFEKDFTQSDYKHLEQFGDLGTEVLNKLTNSSIRNKKIVEHYKKNSDKYGKTIVFAIDVMHCKTLDKEFKDNGIDSDYVAYGRPENADIIANFKNTNSPMVLISVIKLTEGFDAPNIHTVFITRPTRSEVLLRQMIGRGLRGPAAGGTKDAYLVTFVDTWELFQPINSEYVLAPEETEGIVVTPQKTTELTPISDDLIYAAYSIIKQKTNVAISGIFEALPFAWYQWTDSMDNEVKENLIMIFKTQFEGYEKLKEYYQNNISKIPQAFNETSIKDIINEYFGDCPDPLPNSYDVFQLLVAIKKGIEINRFTFQEKESFSPLTLAEKYKDLTRNELRTELRNVFSSNDLCKKTYKGIFQNFYDEVSRQIDKIINIDDELNDEWTPADLINKPLLQEFKNKGYDLEKLYNSIITKDNGDFNNILFPNGCPPKYKLSFTDRDMKTYFGICRYSDHSIKINKILNSPDVPQFVVEFVLYHEILHTDMPNDGHDAAFRERERKFSPSFKAIEEAKGLGYEPTDSVDYYWYIVGNQFLYSLEKRFSIKISN